MSIITISRQYGSLGKEIGEKLAVRLGYRFIDKTTLEDEKGMTGIPSVPFEKFDEKTPRFLEYFKSGKDSYLRYLKTVLYENAREGNCVICGRGSQFLFKDLPGVLRVRFIASDAVRTMRIMEKTGCGQKNAEKIMIANDRDRSGFHRFFFEQSWKDPDLYDLVINTDKIDDSAAIDLIEKTAQSAALACDPEELHARLEDKYIAQEVVIALLYERHIPVDLLDVTCSGGKVTIKGTVTVEQNIDQCVQAAKTVKGVKEVDPEIYFITNYMGF